MPKFPKRVVSNWIKSVADIYKKRVGDISYIFCSDDEILELNQKYLSHNYYTDIITFDYTNDDIIAGDIFISLDTVSTNAMKYYKNFEQHGLHKSLQLKINFKQELYRVMIHGILHLCGIKDKTKKEKTKMRERETQALKNLLVSNNYLNNQSNEVQL